MTKMDVAPVSVTACNVMIVMAFNALCEVGPNNAWAAIAHACGVCVRTRLLLEEERFDMITVVSLSHLPVARVKVVSVGSREVKVFAETKLLNLYAIFFSAPSLSSQAILKEHCLVDTFCTHIMHTVKVSLRIVV